MQFRAGVVYIVLFLVVAAGAYGVIATADSPEVTIDEADADYQLSEHDEITINDRVFNLTEIGDGSGTLTHAEEAVLDVEWEGQGDGDWDDGDVVELEEDDEYHVFIELPEEAEVEDDDADDEEADAEADDDEAEEGNDDEADDNDEADEEPQPEAFLLIESFDDDEFDVIERDGKPHVIVEEDDSEVLVDIEDFEDIDTQRYQVGDEIEFFEEEMEEQIDGEVAEITTADVTIEYDGEEETTFDLENREIATIEGEEFGVYFQSPSEVYLTENVDDFEQQQDEVETFHERIEGLWWTIALAVITAMLLSGLAFLPVRG